MLQSEKTTTRTIDMSLAESRDRPTRVTCCGLLFQIHRDSKTDDYHICRCHQTLGTESLKSCSQITDRSIHQKCLYSHTSIILLTKPAVHVTLKRMELLKGLLK